MARIKGVAVTNLTGRVGNLVFRNRGGENIVSQRPASVRNPRTEPQQLQRAIMSTVVQAYSGLKFICDHSFEGVTYGAKSMEFFMKKNLSIVRETNESWGRALVARGNTAVAWNKYMVSCGSLPSVNVTADPTRGLYLQYTIAEGGQELTKWTLRNLIDSLGAKPGDQVTLARIIYEDDKGVDVPGTNYDQPSSYIQRYSRFTFKPVYVDSDYNKDVIVNNKLNPDLFEELVGFDGLSVSFESLGTLVSVLKFKDDIEDSAFMGTIILSRKNGDSWLRSTQYFDFDRVDSNRWAFEPFYQANVLPTYDPASPYYLNNADN